MSKAQDRVQQKMREANLLSQGEPKATTSSSSSSFLTMFLGCCVILLTCLSMSLGLHRMGVFDGLGEWRVWERNAPAVTAPVQPVQPIVYVTADELSKMSAGLDRRFEQMDERLKEMNLHVWLLAVANNENANLAIAIHKNDPGYIFFDREWMLTRKPQTLELNEDQKKRIEENSR